MPKKDLCEMVVLLDRSGSMTSIKNDMIGGYDALIADQCKVPGECQVTLTQFDSESIDIVYEAKPVAAVPTLVFEPRGGTPLLDAIGQTIDSVGKRLAATSENSRPEHILFLIITDGHENMSKKFSKAEIKALIEQQTNQWKWTFSFLGANMDAIGEAASYGIPADSSGNFEADSTGVASAYASASLGTRSLRSGGSYQIPNYQIPQSPSNIPTP